MGFERVLAIMNSVPLATTVIVNYGDVYKELDDNREFIIGEIEKESVVFERTLEYRMKRE
jgi:alanyl-tRNA synthetase